MRAAGAARPPDPVRPERSTAEGRAESKDTRRYAALPEDLTDLGERVVFRFQLGYAIDQGVTFPGTPFTADTRALRLYTLGDAVVGSKGILQPSLTTYFAARFQFDQDGAPAGPVAVPSIYDATDQGGAVLVRSAWAQFDKVGGPWLRPLLVRAGRQFRYGAALAHFDGLSLAYDARHASASAFYGRRVALYDPSALVFGTGLGGDPGLMGGGSLRLRLKGLARAPLVVGGDYVNHDGASHFEGQVVLEATAGSTVTASARTRDYHIAHWRAELRTRLSATTTIRVELDDRRDDWIYDHVLDAQVTRGDDPHRWLQLGPIVSRLRATVRAGTVLFGNFDTLLYGAVAYAHDEETVSSFAPTYVELGAAAEARLRHRLSVGVEARVRRYVRKDPDPTRDPEKDVGAFGEDRFREGSATVRYSLGAKHFASEASAVLRIYDQTPLQGPDATNTTGGGRLRIEGWAGPRFRVLGEYEIMAVRSPIAPEVEGLQSVRLVGEAQF